MKILKFIIQILRLSYRGLCRVETIEIFTLVKDARQGQFPFSKPIWPIDRSFRPLYRYQAANTSRGCTISWINFQTHRFPSHAYRIFERDQTTQSGTSTSDKTNDRSARMQLDSRFVRSAKKFTSPSVGLKLRVAFSPSSPVSHGGTCISISFLAKVMDLLLVARFESLRLPRINF